MFNNGKMCVFIRKDAYEIACSFPHTSEQFRHLMKTHAGLWLDVDTDTLFRDQFNVKFHTGDWVRLPYMYVGTVRNDKRLGQKLCMNCGKSSVYKDKAGRYHTTCPNCKRSDCFWVYQQDPATYGVIC